MTPEQMQAMLAEMMKKQGAVPQGAGQTVDQSVSAGALDAIGNELRGAKVGNAHGRNLPVGRHRVRIEGAAFRSTFFGLKFFLEYTVLESENGAELGGRYSCGMNAEDKNDKYKHGRNDIRKTIALLALSRGKIDNMNAWDPALVQWVSAAGSVDGVVLDVEVREKQTKERVIYPHDFSLPIDQVAPVPVAVTSDLAAQLAAMPRPDWYPAEKPWPPVA